MKNLRLASKPRAYARPVFSVTVVAMLLGIHGGEAAREVKFQGALLAQAELPGPPPPPPLVGLPMERPPLNDGAQQKQIDALLADRPGLTAPTVLLVIGGSLLGTSLTAVFVVAFSGGGIALAVTFVLAGFVALVALVPTIIGAVMMYSRVQARHSIDARVKLLRQSPADVPVGLAAPAAGAVLATF